MSHQLKSVIVATDFSRASTVAMSLGTRLAGILGCHMSLVHVFGYSPAHRYPIKIGWMVQEIRKRALRQLRAAKSRVASEGVGVDVFISEGTTDAATQILERCANSPSPIAVLGTHSRDSYERFFIGSTAEQILRHALCPVITAGPHVKPYWQRPLRKMMLATDLTERSLAPIPVLGAMNVAGGSLIVLHVASPDSLVLPADWADGIRSSLIASFGREFVDKKVEFRLVVHANPVEAVCDAARSEAADLLAIGMHPGTSMTAHLNPKTGFQIVMSASCAVLSVCE